MGFLSSQPKRSWGGEDDEEENDRPEFDLAEDWLPTPPKAKKVALALPLSKGKETFAGGVTSHSASTSGSRPAGGGAGLKGAGSWTGGAGPSRPSSSSTSFSSTTTSKPIVNKPPSFLAQASSKLGSQPSSKPAQLASIFKNQSRISSTATSSSSNYKVTSAPASSSHASSSSSGVPKKRVMPWDGILNDGGSESRARGLPSNFHTVGGTLAGRQDGIKSRMLTSETMDIKQKVILSPEQQMVLKLVVDDEKNVFFTGSAGTGKSVLLREIIASLKRKYKGRQDAVAVTASTGMAACNIGGTTIHSFAGIGLGVEPVEQLVSKVRKNRVASGKWQRVKVLVIDEVSMVDGFLFDKLAGIGSALKKTGQPFGGIQLVVTGDFFQLPPVVKGVATFAFEAKAWKNSIQHTVNLTQVFRQKDTRFIDMLNEMRFGTLSSQSITMFRSLNRDPNYQDGIDPTELFPMRSEVDRSNEARLRALPGEAVNFQGEDWPSESKGNSSKNTYLSNFMAPEKLVLKVGAQVMLIKNLDTTLVNGTIGKVVGFGVPDLDDEDEEGGEGMKLEDGASERKKAKLVQGAGQGRVELAPVIEWRMPGGVERKIMVREEFKVEDPKGVKLASRKQYPIILAWAMSIHKSQGQTLPRVKVDLGKVFEKGQSYVALSRATCLEGLQVLRFHPDKVAAHPKVVQWSKSLEVLG